jgi:hypothetical protein
MRTSISILCSLVVFSGSFPAFGETLLDEPFTYEDGLLATVSGGLWTEYSGSGGENIVSNQLSLDDNGSGDDGRSFAVTTSGSVFTSFTIRVSPSDPPTSAGTTGYFFALRPQSPDDPNFNYYNRMVVYRPPGSTTGSYTLAFAAQNNSDQVYTDWATELAMGNTYTIVTALDLATGNATLWVNPVDFSSINISSLGEGVIPSIESVIFRVSATSNGDKVIDDLKIGTAFTDVAPVPEPGIAALFVCGLGVMLFGTRRA